MAGRGDDAKTIEIVGIVPATRWQLFEKSKSGKVSGGREGSGHVYVPFAQGYQSNAFFHVRFAPAVARTIAAGDRTPLDQVRRALRAAAPGLPVFSTKTFRQHIESSVSLWIVRVGAVLFSIFGALALVLAVVGVYGVKAYSVARRTREIGIRMALGAAPGAVLRLVFREGLWMTLSGAALGLLLAVGIGRVASSLLYRVSPFDPWAFTVAPLALIAAALLACWLPARRATRVNPLVALRAE
jgi:ABC-type antimicrobial peptide transport system permease subunit